MINKKSATYKDFKKSYWITSKNIFIDHEGKHIINFQKNFPLVLKSVHFYIDYKLTPNYHDYLEITYALNGNGTFIISNRKYPVKKGDIFIINNIELHTALADHNKTLNLVSIFFLPELIYKPGDNESNLDYLNLFFNQNKNFNPRIPSDKAPSNILNLIYKMYDEMTNRNKYYVLSVKTFLQEIIITLLRYYKDHITYSRTIYNQNLNDIERLRGVFVLIMNNYDKNITLGEAAKTAFMSSHYFCKFFKKVTGHSFKEYLLSIRIDKAKELLLRKNNTSVTAIAYQVGFENLSYFYRVFKKFTKLNPNEYRSTIGSNY